MTSERLEQLRTFARIERTAVLEMRGREGEESGKLAEFAMARLAGQGTGDDAAQHRLNADRAEFELLREIAAGCPELTPAVWLVADRLELVA